MIFYTHTHTCTHACQSKTSTRASPQEEQRLDEQSESGSDGEEAAAAVDVSPCSYTPQPMVLPLNGDEPMEPIEEERTPASMSSSRSFSFVSRWLALVGYVVISWFCFCCK